MNSLLSFIEPLGWALLHFLWQGAAIALVLRGFLRLTRRSAPRIRYAAAAAALALMMAAVAGTLWWQVRAIPEPPRAETQTTEATAMVSAIPAPSTAPLESFKSLPSPEPSTPGNAAPAAPTASPPAPAPATGERLRPLLPWMVGVWAAGVALFSLRLVIGWRTVRRWRASGTATIPAEWQARFAALCERLRLTRPVRMLSSATVAVPVVIGWLKPVVLLPASLLAGMPAAQLEAVLAHELAHVRRHDYLVNLLQTLLETLFFYHPAVWWVSAQLRQEREHCCDDIAASLHGDTLGYARALTALEELRALPAVGVSAAGGSLLQRIRRLAGLPEERAARLAWPVWILTAASLALALLSALPRQALGQERESQVAAAAEGDASRPATPVPGNSQGVPPEESKDKPADGTPGPQRRIIEHKDGTRTEVESDAARSQTTETTYSKSGERIAKRVFYNDKQGRPRQAVIYDGNGKPLGLILFGYDKTTGERIEERQYNKDAKLIRRLFYPGALKDPKYAGRFVAFTYDRDAPGETAPTARFLTGGVNQSSGKEEAGPVRPTLTAEEQEAVPADIERRLALTQGLYDLGQYERALGEIEAVLRQDPLHEAGRQWRQRILTKLERERDPFAVPADPAVLVEARKVSIALTVFDSTGRKPVPEFRVIAGVRAGSAGGKDTINWQPHTLRIGKDGGLLWPLDKAYDEMALRVEADGYAPQVFNWIEKKKGPQDLFFQMVQSGGSFCQVWTPDKKPAAGAVVALAMVQRDAVIESGKLRHLDEAPSEKASDQWRRPRILKANETGRVMIPAETDQTAALLVMHESGVREISLSDFIAGKDGMSEVVWGKSVRAPRVQLQPWARVAGKVQWGDKAGAGQKVSLTIHRDAYGYPGIIAQYEKTTAAADGSFVFEKVLPGHVQLSCPITAAAGNAAGFTEINLTGRIAHTELKSGDNTVVIGGGGTAIKGRLTGRDDWKGVTFHFHPTAPHIGLPGDDEVWKAWGEFQKSPEGALYFRSGMKVNADGTFEIGGVMPGDYQIFFKREGEDKYLANGKFSMKPETVQQEPMDIGEFKAGP